MQTKREEQKKKKKKETRQPAGNIHPIEVREINPDLMLK